MIRQNTTISVSRDALVHPFARPTPSMASVGPGLAPGTDVRQDDQRPPQHVIHLQLALTFLCAEGDFTLLY